VLLSLSLTTSFSKNTSPCHTTDFNMYTEALKTIAKPQFASVFV